jgi:hypothetical protein
VGVLANRQGVRNPTLHGLLQAFTTDAGMRLTLAAASGDEIPFEVVPSGAVPARGAGQARQGRRSPLYCYRPLTADFIRERLGLLVSLPTYAPAARALEGVGGTDAYLRSRGELQIPGSPRTLADTALRLFLWRVFEERSEFGFDEARFALAYAELERAIYRGRCVTEMVAPLLGLDLDPATDELALGDGLSIVRPHSLGTAPEELAAAAEPPPLLIVLRVAHDRADAPAVAFARSRFRSVLTALRLYESGAYAIGAIGYSRVDDGVWSPVALGSSGRPRRLTLIPAAGEDELRGFCNLVSRRLSWASESVPDNSGAGELVWALARFEMGCERATPFEALTDHLLALRALLEPEGPASGRLAQRLAVICAAPEGRAALAERIAEAVALERSVIAGLAPAHPGVGVLVEELAENLRAVLRDVLCGHLVADVRGVADDLLSEAAAAAVA